MLKFLILTILIHVAFVGSEPSGVLFTLQINGLSNPSLPNGSICICPDESDCSVKCRYQFHVMTVMNGGKEYHEKIEFSFPNSDGQLPQPEDQNFTMYFATKPKLIQLYTYDVGSVTTRKDNDSETLANQFLILLHDVLPSTADKEIVHSNQYKGSLDETLLSVSFSIKCLNPFLGPSCDLKCVRNNDSAHCVSSKTGKIQVCQFLANGQVDNCLPYDLAWLASKVNNWKTIVVLLVLCFAIPAFGREVFWGFHDLLKYRTRSREFRRVILCE